MLVIGIDNGLDGGIVGIRSGEATTLLRAITPTLGTGKRSYDIAEMAALLRKMAPVAEREGSMVFLERAQAMPGQGVSSMFSIGYGFGIWQGLLTAMRLPFQIVSPQKWQREMFIGINRGDTKTASALVAQRLRPGTDWRANARCRKPHDGLTDAFCIAEYGRRTMGGQQTIGAGLAG
jgi:crossover junction endodeoxyribonuclease RuvC